MASITIRNFDDEVKTRLRGHRRPAPFRGTPCPTGGLPDCGDRPLPRHGGGDA